MHPRSPRNAGGPEQRGPPSGKKERKEREREREENERKKLINYTLVVIALFLIVLER